MDDSYEIEPEYDLESPAGVEPSRPKRTEPPPLPRLWKDPVDPSPSVETSPAPRKKKRARDETPAAPVVPKPKKRKDEDEGEVDDGTGAAKLEETPVLDTYEARQRARWIVSGVLTLIAVTGLVVGLRAFKASPVAESLEVEPGPDLRASSEAKASDERAARILLDMAKQAEKQNKHSNALAELNKLIKTYQGTAAAREAMHALARAKQERSLFGDDEPALPGGPAPAPTGPAMADGPSPSASSPVRGVATTFAPGPSRPAEGASRTPAAGPAPAPAGVASAVNPIVSKPLPPGYRAKFDFPIHPSGWPTRILCDRDGAEMVLVPAATFLMGRGDGEPQEGPTHEVAVSTFYIDLHEVTVRQYIAFLKDTGRSYNPVKAVGANKPGFEDLPIVNISARDAKEYCLWAKRRLPTEAQWELAARGPEGRISYWNGELFRKDPDRGPRPMEPVMSLSSDVSPYGALDMAANAWEWTSEYYDSRYYKQFRNLVVDPTGPKESPARVAKATVKGGSDRGFLTWREGLILESKLPYLGFRGALPVEGAPIAPPAPPANQIVAPAATGGVQPF